MGCFPMEIVLGILILHFSMPMEFSMNKPFGRSRYEINGSVVSHIGMSHWYMMAALWTNHIQCADMASLRNQSAVLILEENFQLWKESDNIAVELDWLLAHAPDTDENFCYHKSNSNRVFKLAFSYSALVLIILTFLLFPLKLKVPQVFSQFLPC